MKVVGSNPGAVYSMDIVSYEFVVKLYWCLFEKERDGPFFFKKNNVSLENTIAVDWIQTWVLLMLESSNHCANSADADTTWSPVTTIVYGMESSFEIS